MTREPAASAGSVTAGPSGSVTTRQRLAEVFGGRGFRRFFTARAVSQFGDGIFQIATADFLLFREPHSNPAVRLLVLTAITLVPFSVVAPFVGVFIDRWERRKILTWVPLLRACVALATPFAASLGTTSPLFLGVVLIVLSANRFFLATMSAVLPQLVPPDDLLVANSVSSTGGSVANVAGLSFGTLLSGLFSGPQAAFFAAGAFAVSAITAHRVPVHRGLIVTRRPILAEVREVLGQMVEGLIAVGANRRVRFGLSSIAVVQLLVGLMSGILIVAFIVDLDLELQAALKLLLFLGVGIGIGVVFVPVIGRRVRHDLLIPISFVISAVGVAIAMGPVRLTRLTMATLFLGLSYAFAKIPVDTIVQEEMPDELRGRAFAAYDMLFNVARVCGIGLAAGAFAAGMPTARAVSLTGVTYLTTGAIFAVWEHMMFRRKNKQRPADLLLEGEFVTVRAYAGSRADEEPRTLVIGGHEIAVEQIDWRAIVEQPGGRRGRAFIVRAGGKRVRLARYEDETGWLIERVSDLPPDPSQ